jgi:ELWxxDGT repeat protein
VGAKSLGHLQSSKFELWKSDGTEAGTVLLKEFTGGTGILHQDLHFTSFGGQLFFAANDANGFELWKSDGTEAGTVLVKDINRGEGSSHPQDLIHVGGTLYFRADDGTHGGELWKSDGTEAGTVLVKDIRSGNTWSAARHFSNVSGTVYFTADDGMHGSELWKSDGTEGGAVLVNDFVEGSGSSNPTGGIVEAGGKLFVNIGPRGDNMTQLWAADLAVSPAIAGDYNGNGTVDAADYVVWRKTLGSATDLRANGDNTGPSAGVIDQADYVVWRANFGNTSSPAAIAESAQHSAASTLDNQARSAITARINSYDASTGLQKRSAGATSSAYVPQARTSWDLALLSIVHAGRAELPTTEHDTPAIHGDSHAERRSDFTLTIDAVFAMNSQL